MADRVKALVDWLTAKRHRLSIEAIGHRLVQGGPEHREPQLIDLEDEKTISCQLQQ
ncbi:hypothetical protein [Pedobacter hartonius]|uniref:Uncharacterized protein n=1 Tax=Pedobacter hartonius TaxID=425514 RepID=A0A1H4G9H6_9SPHI|nr:hypothetical protein [Pedobacter hartonius]SEB06239.1 hypothetical protein SAMN05443550_109146 [Pedobacter hartonius]